LIDSKVLEQPPSKWTRAALAENSRAPEVIIERCEIKSWCADTQHALKADQASHCLDRQTGMGKSVMPYDVSMSVYTQLKLGSFCKMTIPRK